MRLFPVRICDMIKNRTKSIQMQIGMGTDEEKTDGGCGGTAVFFADRLCSTKSELCDFRGDAAYTEYGI